MSARGENFNGRLTSLCYLERDGQYLILHRTKKQNDENQDKWIGVGGKFEPGETPDACALREVKEETGLTMTDYRLRGLIIFVSDVWGLEYMYLYTASKWRGRLTACDEGELVWLDKRELLRKNLWEGDRLFLKALEERQEFFIMKFRYEGEHLAEVVDSQGLPSFWLGVYQELLKVPDGTGVTYAELARRVGGGSAQAVRQALKGNPFAPEIPCHRVGGAAHGGELCYTISSRNERNSMKKEIVKVLVINSGSSSLKYQLFDMKKGERLAKGLVERIGCGGPKDHTEALKSVVAALGDKAKGIDAIGHRILHGGEVFTDSALMTKANMAKAKKLVKFGPLHMPANLGGVEACEKIFKGVPNVGVFDTAFHIATMPDCAGMYAIDPKYYKKMGIRKYGFHGTSHKFITQEAAKYLKKPLSKVNLVTCHLGNGSSLAAIKDGGVVDTSMGLTPLAGMVMGTRCGDIDAAAVLSIMDAEKLSPSQADTLLNKKSGLLALTGSSDCRDICAKAAAGEKAAELALEMLAYRVALYIGAYNTIVGGADAIIMTGGIGENSDEVRARIIRRLGALGIKLDAKANAKTHGTTAVISAKGSKIPVVVMPTNEELMIARDTVRVLAK